MFKYHQPSQISLRLMGVRLCVLFVLLGLTACQSSPMVSTPTESAPATSSLAPATPFESQPIADGPVLLRADLTLRKVLEVGANNIRLVRNPANGEIYLLNPAEGIFRVSDISASASLEKVASIREIKGAATGIAFGPDGTLYVVLNTTVDETKTQVVVRKGVPTDEGRFTWETLASSEPYPLSNTYYDHLYNGIVVSPDGQWIYINGGSRTEHGEVEDNAGALPEHPRGPPHRQDFTAPHQRHRTNFAE